MAQQIHLILEEDGREVARTTLSGELIAKVDAALRRSKRPATDEHGELEDPDDADPGRYVFKRTWEEWREMEWKHRRRLAQADVPVDDNIGGRP
jgi:hypothetical protein